jgi:putative mRNA 3-end processing factor
MGNEAFSPLTHSSFTHHCRNCSLFSTLFSLSFHYNLHMKERPLLRLTERGLYCEAGDFYIDPWQPVDRAVVTHAHSDHLSRDSRAYLFARPAEHLFAVRLESRQGLQPLEYGETITLKDVKVSLHPAGHILGSAQVRVELNGEVWVFTGDYKTQPDPTCAPFELVKCHTFITEATFGLPIYRWPEPQEEFEKINAWWRSNQADGITSVIYGYSLGKAQRILAGLDASIGPVYTHGAIERLNQAYRRSGIQLPSAPRATQVEHPQWDKALIIAPLSARATPWTRRFGTQSSGFASGWMRVRGARRRRAIDRGFVLSDHVDWPALQEVIRQTGAGRIYVTHGYTHVLARWLQEQGLEAYPLETPFNPEREEGEEESE